jgi:hypothetical protein
MANNTYYNESKCFQTNHSKPRKHMNYVWFNSVHNDLNFVFSLQFGYRKFYHLNSHFIIRTFEWVKPVRIIRRIPNLWYCCTFAYWVTSETDVLRFCIEFYSYRAVDKTSKITIIHHHFQSVLCGFLPTKHNIFNFIK